MNDTPAQQLPRFACLFIERLHRRGSVPIAILLLDPSADRLYFRFRDDWTGIADADSIGVLAGMKDMFTQRAAEEGAVKLFQELEDRLSNYVRMREPCILPVPDDWKIALDNLYREHVDPAS